MYCGTTRSKIFFLRSTSEIDIIHCRSSTEGKMCLLLTGIIVKLVCNCPRKCFRGDVGLGDLTMVEWHSIATHVFLV